MLGMATITSTAFLPGETVEAFRKSTLPGEHGAPSGAAITSAIVAAGGTVTLSHGSLVSGTEYVLVCGSKRTRVFAHDSIAGGEMVKIADAVSGASGLVFSDIPQTFRHLRVIAAMRSAVPAVTHALGRIRLNGLGTDYFTQYSRMGLNAAVATQEGAAAGIYMGSVPAATAAAKKFGRLLLDIPFYREDGMQRNVMGQSIMDDGVSTLSRCEFMGLHFTLDDADITSITLTDQAGGALAAGSAAVLYGLE